MIFVCILQQSFLKNTLKGDLVIAKNQKGYLWITDVDYCV